MKKKKFLVLLLTFIMVFALAACGGDNDAVVGDDWRVTGVVCAGGTITLKLTATGAVSAKLATTATNPRTGATIAYTATCSSTLVPLGGDEYKVFVHFPPKATATVDFPGCSLAIPLKL